MALPATEDFTGSNNAQVSSLANRSNVDGDGCDIWQNQARPDTPTDYGCDRWNADTFNNDQYAEATWTGAIDRSPCGTGTCAKMATLHAKGKLGLNEDFQHEGILGTVFTGRLIGETTVGPYRAVIPTLSGQAWITGFANYVIDAEDPFPEGFTVGDIW